MALMMISWNTPSYGETWEKNFGGSGQDGGYSIQQTSDGGYIIAGYSYVYLEGVSDVYLVKTDGNGNELWSETFGGENNEFGQSVQQTSDGGFVVAGTTGSFGTGSGAVYLVKTDASGDELWSKTFGGSGYDSGNSLQQTGDGGFIIAGTTDSFGAGDTDVYLVKTDANGTELWSKTFGGSGSDEGRSVQQTSDGGYIMIGTTLPSEPGFHDVLLIKTDANGNELWSKTLGGSQSDYGSQVRQTSDGGFIIAGGTDSFGGGETDVYLVKTDASGVELWSKTFGGSDYDSGASVQQTSDGGYIIAGYTNSFGAGGGDAYLIKTDASGDELWSKTFGGSNTDQGDSVQQTTDGGFIVTGFTASLGAGDGDVYLVYYKPMVAVTGLSMSPTNTIQAAESETFAADAYSEDGDSIYYRFDLVPNYGTANYDPMNNWQTIQDFSTVKTCGHTFTETGSYVVVVWASLWQSIPFGAAPIIGGSVTVGDDSLVTRSGLDMNITGTLRAGDSVTFTATAISSDGGDMYYRFDLIPNYGTSDYDPDNNYQTIQGFSAANTCTHTFNQAGSYIIVVWASATPSFPTDIPPPIIGGSVTVE
jgi:hypothetical protein